MIDPTAILDAHRRPGLLAAVSHGWRVETDGYTAVAWHGDTEGLSARPETDGALWPEGAELAPLDLAALRAWLVALVPPLPAPAEPVPVKCPRCRGRGTAVVVCDDCGHEHDCACEDCDGEGTVLPDEPPRPPAVNVELLGGCYDARILARGVAALPGDTATWARATSDSRAPLLLVGDGWRYVCMPRLLEPGEPWEVWP